jgi:hypothetical protein
MAVTPTLYRDFQQSVLGQVRPTWSNPLLMLHERAAPGGVRHVVAVQFQPAVMFNDTTIYDHAPQKFRITHRQSKQRTLVVTAWPVGTAAAPEPAGEAPMRFVERTYRLALPDTREREIAYRYVDARMSGEPGPVDYGNVLRFYAGQPDSGDASHFTLPYRLDGREGVIDGWVRDNGVELRARDGEWVFDGGDVLRLRAPATRPTVYPPPAGMVEAGPGAGRH